MKSRMLFIGDDAVAEIRRALTVNKLAQSGTNPVFTAVARKILDAVENDECVLLLTAQDKQKLSDDSDLRTEECINETNRAKT